jgi:hypothetical protein
VSDGVVYIGGHFRYLNDYYGFNQADDGAVARPGVAALDPANGLPFSWNPGRNPRGAGASALFADSSGLYVGSDTDWIGNYQYFRGKLAYFPKVGGKTLPVNDVKQLPGKVYGFGRSASSVMVRETDGHQVTAESWVPFPVPGTTASMHGAFMVDGSMYYFGFTTLDRDTTTLHKRSFDGSTFGPEVRLDPYHDATWDGVATGTKVIERHKGTPIPPLGQVRMTYFKGMAPDIFAAESEQIQGVFFSNGRIYYSLLGQPTLYYRYFTPESGIIGAARFTVPGVDLSDAKGMFLSNDTIYWASNSSPNLMATPFNNGAPDGTKTSVAVSPTTTSPSQSSWASTGLFVG